MRTVKQASPAQIVYLNSLRKKLGLPKTKKTSAYSVGKELTELKARHEQEVEIPRYRQALRDVVEMAERGDDREAIARYAQTVLFRSPGDWCEWCFGNGCSACMRWEGN